MCAQIGREEEQDEEDREDEITGKDAWEVDYLTSTVLSYE